MLPSADKLYGDADFILNEIFEMKFGGGGGGGGANTFSHRAMWVWICFPFIKKSFIYKLHVVFTCVIFD